MLATKQTTEELKEKIRNDLDRLDSDDVREIYALIAKKAGKKAIKHASKIWSRSKLSRNNISQTIQEYRNSKK